MARRLTGRRVDHAQVASVRDEPHRHADVAEQPLELRGRGVPPRTRHVLGAVEVERPRVGGVVAEVPDESDPGRGRRRPSLRCRCVRGFWRGLGVRLAELGEGIAVAGRRERSAPDREARPNSLLRLGRVERELFGQGLAPDKPPGSGIAEEALEEPAHVTQRQAPFGLLEFGPQLARDLRPRRGRDLGVGEHGNREDEALRRLGKAEPGPMERPIRVARPARRTRHGPHRSTIRRRKHVWRAVATHLVLVKSIRWRLAMGLNIAIAM